MKIIYTLHGITECHKSLSVIDLPTEIWRYIPNTSQKYMVSNMGRIKSLFDCNGNYREKIRAQGYDKDGYCRLVLYGSGKPKYLKIHTIVADVFCVKPSGTTQVNHINGIKTDNRMVNLEWCTLQHNITHSIETGLKKTSPGEKNGMAKLTEQQVLSILSDKRVQHIIAKEYNIKQSTVSAIKTGKIWSHLTEIKK